jgi:hypothetical protein
MTQNKFKITLNLYMKENGMRLYADVAFGARTGFGRSSATGLKSSHWRR